MTLPTGSIRDYKVLDLKLCLKAHCNLFYNFKWTLITFLASYRFNSGAFRSSGEHTLLKLEVYIFENIFILNCFKKCANIIYEGFNLVITLPRMSESARTNFTSVKTKVLTVVSSQRIFGETSEKNLYLSQLIILDTLEKCLAGVSISLWTLCSLDLMIFSFSLLGLVIYDFMTD